MRYYGGASKARDQMKMQVEDSLPRGRSVQLLNLKSICVKRCYKHSTNDLDCLHQKA